MNTNPEQHMANRIDELKQHNEKVKLGHAAAAMDQLQAQRAAYIDAHLKTLVQEQNEDAQMVITIAQASIHEGGMPNIDDAEAFASGCERVALALTRANRTRQWAETKVLLDGLNARTPDGLMVAAAKRAGVELSQVLVPPPPQLVQG